MNGGTPKLMVLFRENAGTPMAGTWAFGVQGWEEQGFLPVLPTSASEMGWGGYPLVSKKNDGKSPILVGKSM